jgi:diguanylate cyclase (GGDEF)-like protein
MAAPDRMNELLLELGAPSARTSRSSLLARALRTAGPLVDADAVVVVLGTAKKPAERLVLHAGSDLPAVLPLPAEGSEALRVLAEMRQEISFADLSENAAFAVGDACPGVEAGPVLFAPLTQHGGRPAYLAVYRKRGRARLTAPETQAILLLATWLGAALEAARLAARTQKQSITDDQTEAYNDRFLRTELKREIRRAHRYEQELSVVRVALDPIVSATPGDDAREPATLPTMMKDLAGLLGGHVRSFDVLGRAAEDSFLIVLPQTGKEGAMEVAGRVRAAVAAHAFTAGEAGTVTASLAVASFPHDGVDAEALWAVSERVLAEARERGGNCVASTAKRRAA